MVASFKHALVVGASSGIGLAVAKEIAPLVTKLTLCSRSCPEDLVASIKAKNPDVEVVHEKLDVSLMHEVRKFTTKHADTKFDWVVLTPGIMTFNGRNETVDGLDAKMATYYYGRFMLVNDLLANLNRPGVRVLSVLAAGRGCPSAPDDMDLKRTYSAAHSTNVTGLYSDLMAQAFSERAPHASFMHNFPGYVNTDQLKSFPWYVRTPSKLFSWIGRKPEVCAERMVSAFTNPEYASGWWLLGPDAEVIPKTKYHTDEMKTKVWEHTTKTIEEVMKTE